MSLIVSHCSFLHQTNCRFPSFSSINTNPVARSFDMLVSGRTCLLTVLVWSIIWKSTASRWEWSRCQWQPLLRRPTLARTTAHIGICWASLHWFPVTTTMLTQWSGKSIAHCHKIRPGHDAFTFFLLYFVLFMMLYFYSTDFIRCVWRQINKRLCIRMLCLAAQF